LKVYKSNFSSIIGNITIFADDKQLICVNIGNENNPNKLFKNQELSISQNEIIVNAEYELGKYFSGKLHKFSVPMKIIGTKNEVKVLNTLKNKVKYGELISYSDLSKLTGIENGARFIGNVLNRNSLPIFIPCHRVIKKDGSIGGFNAGLTIKKKLIDLENNYFNEIFH
jgi:methylated-DNA-[protein]-cysteine S-methyltransferase